VSYGARGAVPFRMPNQLGAAAFLGRAVVGEPRPQRSVRSGEAVERGAGPTSWGLQEDGRDLCKAGRGPAISVVCDELDRSYTASSALS
jgi:hypothetical protein